MSRPLDIALTLLGLLLCAIREYRKQCRDSAHARKGVRTE
jgi:hypothetical protein